MKKILSLIVVILISTTTFGQCLSIINGSKSKPFPPNKLNTYLYVDGGVDLNNIMNLDKTDMEPQGFDFDIEIGRRMNNISVYGFYGEFEEIDYQNYGVGLDYFFIESRTFDISAGVNMGGVSTSPDITHFAYAVRIKPVLSLTDAIGLFLNGQYQQRPDRLVHGLVEVSGGIQFKIF